MDNLTSYILKLLEKISFTTGKDLQYSILNELNKISENLNIVNSKILKTSEHKKFLQKTIEDKEELYQLSKNDLEQFEKVLNKKIKKFEKDINNNSTETSNICNIKSISTKYNNLITNNNENIFEKYESLKKSIEINIVQCEISKENIQPVNKLLVSLESDKNILETKKKNLEAVQSTI